jgi:putative ABC transport system permease protein
VFKSYFAVAIRSLLRQGIHSTINVAGLAVGVTCCLLIAVFVRHELSFDRYHSRADRIYRISRDFLPLSGRPEIRLAAMPAAAAPLLAEDFPQIEKAARISYCSGASGGALVASGNATFYETGLAAADNELFEIFDFDWLHGDSTAALRAPSSVVLTESSALKYFGKTNVLGETLILENVQTVEVTGIIADLPDNTHLSFSMVASMQYLAATLGDESLRDWGLNCYHTYALLAERADPADVQRRAGEFFERHLGSGASKVTRFSMVPVTDIHLNSAREGEIRAPGSATTVYGFAAIAVFVLALAGINYMNLATARSALRAKEVGLRKAAGSRQGPLVVQFLGEAVLIALFSVAAGAAAAKLLLPAFGNFVQKSLVLDFGDAWTLPALVALTLSLGIAAGGYPAFYLSAFSPVKVLRGDVTRGAAAASLRKILVGLQFAISISLIIATTVVYEQTRYAQAVELGYNKDQIVVLRGSPTQGLGTQWEALKREWLTHPDVLGVTASSLTPGMTNNNAVPVAIPGDAREPTSMALMIVDFDFFETYEIDLLSGRTFSKDFGTDRLKPASDSERAFLSVVVSELAVRRLGLTLEEAIGRSLDAFGASATIVGVVEDAHLESVRYAIKPVIYAVPPQPQPGQPATLREGSIRVAGRNLADTLGHIDAKWRELVPDQPITRRFLDEDFEALYRNESHQARILLYFSVLAVFIACLGLFGLASFTTQQRSKEIGIRKVMGGSVLDIVWLFTEEFAKLVLIASLVAWPVAHFFMRRWLESFAYRIELSPVVFMSSALLVLVVAVLTVGATAAHAGSTRPVHSLRHD